MKAWVIFTFLLFSLSPFSTSPHAQVEISSNSRIASLQKQTAVAKDNSVFAEENAISADKLISSKKPDVLEAKASSSTIWNMVSKNLENGSLDFFNFDEHDYSYRQFAYDKTSTLSALKQVSNTSMMPAKGKTLENSDGSALQYTEGYNPFSSEEENAVSSAKRVVIGNDDRVLVNDTTAFPYRCAGELTMTYNKVYNKELGRYISRYFRGTAFLEGPDLLVTAGHCVYADVTSSSIDSSGKVNAQ